MNHSIARLAAALLAVTATGTVIAQTLPPDIDLESYSRLPLIPKSALDADGQQIFETINGDATQLPRLGPPASSMYSLAAAKPYYMTK